MRRVTGLFGGDPTPPSGGNPDSNTLTSVMATVICLDDYHRLDRTGRKKEGVTALDPKAQDFDLMYEQVRLPSGVCEYVSKLCCSAELISAAR
jgi:phosphoribulokinase